MTQTNFDGFSMATTRPAQHITQSDAQQQLTARERAHKRLQQLIKKMTTKDELPDLIVTYESTGYSNTDSRYQFLFLHVAGDSRYNDLRILIANVEINVKNRVGDTALHYAVLKKNKACYNLLVSAGADENVKNNCGQIPRDLEREESKLSLSSDNNASVEPDLTSWLKNKSITELSEGLRYAADEGNLPILKKIIEKLKQSQLAGTITESIVHYLENTNALIRAGRLEAAGDKSDFSCYFYLLDFLESQEGGAELIARQDAQGKTAEDYFIEYHEKVLQQEQQAVLQKQQESKAREAAAKEAKEAAEKKKSDENALRETAYDDQWIGTLVALKLPDPITMHIRTTLTELRTAISNEKAEQEREKLRASAREKIAWLIIMANYRIFLNKTVLLGMLLAALITAALVGTGAISVPSLLVGAAIILGGGLVGASVKRFAAYQHSYRFKLFTEPAQLSNPEVEKTALVASAPLSSPA